MLAANLFRPSAAGLLAYIFLGGGSTASWAIIQREDGGVRESGIRVHLSFQRMLLRQDVATDPGLNDISRRGGGKEGRNCPFPLLNRTNIRDVKELGGEEREGRKEDGLMASTSAKKKSSRTTTVYAFMVPPTPSLPVSTLLHP